MASGRTGANVVDGNLVVVGTDLADTIIVNTIDATHPSVTINGAAAVTYVDIDAGRCVVAEALGATVVQGEPEPSLGAFPVTVDGTLIPEGLVATLRLTEWGGCCTSLAQLAANGSLPLFELYTRGVPLHIGRAMARPAIPAILDLVAAGRLRPQVVTSATVAWDEAPQALLEPATKLVVQRA